MELACIEQAVPLFGPDMEGLLQGVELPVPGLCTTLLLALSSSFDHPDAWG